MEKKLYRQKGYYIEIDSWENDADNQRCVTFPSDSSIESESDVKIYTDFIKLFTTYDETGKWYRGTLANIYDPNSAEAERVNQVLLDFDVAHDNFSNETDEDYITDFYYELMSAMGLTSSDFFTRVAAKYSILYFEDDVYVFTSKTTF